MESLTSKNTRRSTTRYQGKTAMEKLIITLKFYSALKGFIAFGSQKLFEKHWVISRDYNMAVNNSE